jgi:hypothetical protein
MNYSEGLFVRCQYLFTQDKTRGLARSLYALFGPTPPPLILYKSWNNL